MKSFVLHFLLFIYSVYADSTQYCVVALSIQLQFIFTSCVSVDR